MADNGFSRFQALLRKHNIPETDALSRISPQGLELQLASGKTPMELLELAKRRQIELAKQGTRPNKPHKDVLDEDRRSGGFLDAGGELTDREKIKRGLVDPLAPVRRLPR